MAPAPTVPRAVLDIQIIKVVKRLDRTHGRVFPWMVQPWLDVYRCEQTLRKDMARLAENGYLERVSARKGYKPPKKLKFPYSAGKMRRILTRARVDHMRIKAAKIEGPVQLKLPLAA